MVFGHKRSSQYLVTASETHLQVWDLLSCSQVSIECGGDTDYKLWYYVRI